MCSAAAMVLPVGALTTITPARVAASTSIRSIPTLATPTTLIGMLRAVAYGWRQAALAESAAEVFRLGRELHEKLGLMGNRFDKLGRALRSSVNAYNETIATVEGTVLVRARKFRDLKVSEKELPGPTQINEAVRQIQAAELVDDAVQVEPMVGRGRRRRREGLVARGDDRAGGRVRRYRVRFRWPPFRPVHDA